LRVLKALGRQIDIYQRALAAGETVLKAPDPFAEVAAAEAVRGYLETLAREGEPAPALQIQGPRALGGKKMTDAFDSGLITRAEAEAALNDPENGSLRVLKALGKQRDAYAQFLLAGQKRLVVHNPFEEVCAKAAIADYREALQSEGEEVPGDLSLFRSGVF
jgi:predicted RNase H-like HicB family nuclease